MTTEADTILLNLKPEQSEKFWCWNCQANRNTADRMSKTLSIRGRTQTVIGCVHCMAKKSKLKAHNAEITGG